jgi:hypothetical protein
MSFAGKTQVKYKRTYSYGRHVSLYQNERFWLLST